MRIQNNITAMNTHRQYTINNDNVAKAAEKLSSGYRINRAGDDAAGLAISEKMRSQIRGLNMATKNSQDAISLVQTAEGALQETHSMLQRMNELAVQAATGTNQEEDRLALAKEFDQLKKEINDIAEQTTFNNMKVLDGSLSYTGYVRSAQTAGMTNTATELPNESAAVKPNKVSDAAPAVTAVTTATPASFEVTIDNNGSIAAGATGTLTIGGKTVTSASNTAASAAALGNDVAALFDGKTVELDGVTYKATATGAKLKFEAQDTSKDITMTLPTVTASIGGTGAATVSNAVNGVAVKEAADAKSDEWTAEIKPENLKAGDKITVGDPDNGGKEYEITSDDLKLDSAALMTQIAGKLTTTGGVVVTADGNTLTAKSTGQTATDKGTAEIKFKPANTEPTSYKNTIELDTAKMKDGDKFTVTIGGETQEITFSSDEFFTDKNQTAAEKMAAALAGKFETVNVSPKGNAIIFEGAKVNDADMKLTSATTTKAADYPTNAIRIQVGALEDEQLAVSIDSMNTAGLGLDGQNLYSQNEAGMAITATRAAVQKVSDQRATLGAMQNRLDHKIANLKVSSENLSAAESRIRDVDMASEMTNFTKNNILSQAATAMLAQANSLPQNVLSLLG